MKVLIIEDEKPAVKRLEKLFNESGYPVEIVAALDTVRRAVSWFASNPMPDLAFFDIQLADGESFQIFEKVEVKCPVIFTTAYDQYALKAFEVNSVDYLLKPIDQHKLQRAMDKYIRLYERKEPQIIDPKLIRQLVQDFRPETYKERFVVKYGDHLKSISVSDILCFFSLEKATFFVTSEPKKYLVDFSLEQVESMLDPREFFRINRKYMVHIQSIQDIITYSNSRLKLKVRFMDDHDMVVAREKVQDFKQWLDR